MKAYEILFQSGLSRVIYAKNEENARLNAQNADHIDYIIDVVQNLKNQKDFQTEYEPLLQSMSVLQAKQELKTKKSLFEQAQAEGLLPPGQSPLLR